MKRNLIVLQEGYKDCGASCLLSIIRYYNGNISINKLIEMTNTNKNGTTFYNLKIASRSLGLNSKSYKLDSMDNLKDIDMPLICQFVSNNYEHFVVIYRITKDKIIIMDPAIGERNLSKVEFNKLWTGYIMIFSPFKKMPIYKEDKYLNKIIKDIIFKNKSLVLNILILSLIFTVISFIYAFYSQIIIDKIINTTTIDLTIVTFIFSIVILIKIISSFFRNIIVINLNQKIDCSLFLNTFNKILLLPYNYYKNKTTGEIISRINDLEMIKNLMNKIILTVFLDIIISFGCSFILYFLNKKMFMMVLVIIILYIFIYFVFRTIIKKYTNIIQENNGNINSKLVEYISGFETIKNLNIESSIEENIEKCYIHSLNDVFCYDNICNLELFLKDIVLFFGILLISYYGYKLVMLNYLSLGSVITFISLINFILEPLSNMLDLSHEYYYAKNAIKRVNNLFNIDDENFELKTNLQLEGNIAIKNLSFSYNSINTILNNISFTIHKGEKILLLGRSGSGKSTILKLLYKYYAINRGMIFIDGIDINDYSLDDIRSNLVYISQDELLFTDTIKNNIIMNRNIKYDNFLEICNLTNINDIVKDLFLGYETVLEENGKNISGGQKQRIILARAFLKNSKIILIDEGFGEMDVELERIILKKIFNRYKDRTFIIISHRLENLDLYNRVLNLNNGVMEGECSIPLNNAYN